jgi:hypothetical protein
MKTAEENYKSCSNCYNHYRNGNKCDARPCYQGSNWKDKNSDDSQFRTDHSGDVNKMIDVTDEEIERHIANTCITLNGETNYREGARWMRDRMKGVGK